MELKLTHSTQKNLIRAISKKGDLHSLGLLKGAIVELHKYNKDSQDGKDDVTDRPHCAVLHAIDLNEDENITSLRIGDCWYSPERLLSDYYFKVHKVVLDRNTNTPYLESGEYLQFGIPRTLANVRQNGPKAESAFTDTEPLQTEPDDMFYCEFDRADVLTAANINRELVVDADQKNIDGYGGDSIPEIYQKASSRNRTYLTRIDEEPQCEKPFICTSNYGTTHNGYRMFLPTYKIKKLDKVGYIKHFKDLRLLGLDVGYKIWLYDTKTDDLSLVTIAAVNHVEIDSKKIKVYPTVVFSNGASAYGKELYERYRYLKCEVDDYNMLRWEKVQKIDVKGRFVRTIADYR